MDKCRLELIGITYNQIESGVYAVILQEAGGTRRIPIIIGYPEAQSIECKLQEVVTPRPLTHDLMANILDEFGVTLLEVNISKLPNGVFAAELLMRDSKGMHVIDSRSSDAIALAIRVNAPIYTTRQVLNEAGFEPDSRNTQPKTVRNRSADMKPGRSPKPASARIDYLRSAMQHAAEAENYEEAARIKAEIERLESQQDSAEDQI